MEAPVIPQYSLVLLLLNLSTLVKFQKKKKSLWDWERKKEPLRMVWSSGILKESGLKDGWCWCKGNWKWWKSKNWNTALMQPEWVPVAEVLVSFSATTLLELVVDLLPTQYHSLPISSKRTFLKIKEGCIQKAYSRNEKVWVKMTEVEEFSKR